MVRDPKALDFDCRGFCLHGLSYDGYESSPHKLIQQFVFDSVGNHEQLRGSAIPSIGEQRQCLVCSRDETGRHASQALVSEINTTMHGF